MKETDFYKKVVAAGLEKEVLNIGRGFLASVAEEQIANGDLDPNGKSAVQIAIEAGRRMLKNWPLGAELALVMSHQDRLLEHARLHRRQGNSEIACLFYATWFEHWINSVLIRSRCHLTEDDKKQMLRDVPIRGKLSWLLGALGYPRIPSVHADRVMRIGEIRNGFVHYKWLPKEKEQEVEERKRVEDCLNGVEQTIRYFLRFEDKHQLKGSRKLLSQIEGKPKRKK
jgi:hypothetical protein